MGLTMGRMASGQNAQANGVKTMEALGVKTIAELRAKPLNELTGLSAGGLIVDGYRHSRRRLADVHERQAERR